MIRANTFYFVFRLSICDCHTVVRGRYGYQPHFVNEENPASEDLCKWSRATYLIRDETRF